MHSICLTCLSPRSIPRTAFLGRGLGIRILFHFLSLSVLLSSVFASSPSMERVSFGFEKSSTFPPERLKGEGLPFARLLGEEEVASSHAHLLV